MQIEGQANKDHTEIRIVVKCEDENEFNAFSHFFSEMMDNMSKHADGPVIDVANQVVYNGSNATDEEIVDKLMEHAKGAAVDRNKDLTDAFRSKFL
jgi:hypothetical protein